MTAIARILVAIADADSRNQPGLVKGVQLARRTGAELDVFHCLFNPQIQRGLARGRRRPENDIEALVEASRRRLERRAGPDQHRHAYAPLIGYTV